MFSSVSNFKYMQGARIFSSDYIEDMRTLRIQKRNTQSIVSQLDIVNWPSFSISFVTQHT